MADVARRTQPADHLGPRAAEADYARQLDRERSRRARILEDSEPSHPTGRRTTVGRRARRSSSRRPSLGRPDGVVANESRPPYVMEVVAQPPSTVRAGNYLDSTITVRLRTSRIGPTTEPVEPNRLFAVATLTAVRSTGTTEPVAPGVLTGPRLVDSVRSLEEDEEQAPDTVGFVSFPNLMIRQEGTYRIVVSLIQMGGNGVQTQGGLNLQSVETRHIVVEGNIPNGPLRGQSIPNSFVPSRHLVEQA